MGAADMGETFSNFMLSMAQLKARQSEIEQAQSFRQAELDQRGQQFNREMDMKAPLIDAQVQNFIQDALMNKQKTETGAAVAGRAEDAGLAAFGQEMSQNPEYDPLKTSFLQNTPENRQMLMAAMLAKNLTGNAATDPSSAARMSLPVEANRGTTVFAPSGRTIGQGPAMPTPAHSLSPGAVLVDESGQQIAQNPTSAKDSLAALVSLFRGTGDLMGTLSADKGLGPAYQASPEMGNTFTNASDLNQTVMKMLAEELRKRGVDPTAAMAGGTNAAPASGKSKYKVLEVK